MSQKFSRTLPALLLQVAWTGSFGGIQQVLLWSRVQEFPGSLVPPWGWLEGWAQLYPFPAPDRFRASPGGVSCRAVVLMTVGASGSDSDCTADRKEQLSWFGLETGTASLPSTYYWPKQSQCLPRFKGGVCNLLNGKRIKEFVAPFNQLQTLRALI